MAVGAYGGHARWPRTSEIDWLSPEELVREAFRRSRVVMLNEAQAGMQRCVRNRRVGTRVLPVAWAGGARVLAMELLGPPGGQPTAPEVLEQPDMTELLAKARALGFRLTGYDADGQQIPLKLRTLGKSPTFSNWRDDQQARNLTKLLAELPEDQRMLVWATNLHHAKIRFMQYQPTGWRFRTLSGVDPFIIDQTVTVTIQETRRMSPILQWAQSELRRRGGEAGYVWREGLPRLSPGCDAWILSLDNKME